MSTTVTTQPSEEIARLARDLKAMGGKVSRHLNREYKTAARPVAQDAAQNASWSTTIPPAIKLRASRSKQFPGADVVVPKSIPHARLYEGMTKGGRGSFRHKVFDKPPRPTVWVSQQTRPFIRPAVKANREGFKTASDAAVITVAREHGFT
jgi:hypothetical protein